MCIRDRTCATATAQVWDETINGGGDAEDFPAGSFQTTANSGFNTITGDLDVLADPDRDSYLITVTDPSTFLAQSVEIGGVGDTRMWLWDMSGNLIMGNDDYFLSGDFLAGLTDPSTWDQGLLLDSPGSLTAGTEYVLTIGGFSTDPADGSTAAPDNGVDLADINNNSGLGFTTLSGPDPAAGPFVAWEEFAAATGTYQINLTGAAFGGGGGGGGCPSGFEVGDVNQDGSVDLLDVSPFVDLLIEGNFQCEADVTLDGTVDLLDVSPFVDLLTGG